MTYIYLEICVALVCTLELSSSVALAMLVIASSASSRRPLVAWWMVFASWKPLIFVVSLWQRSYKQLASMKWYLNVAHIFILLPYFTNH